MPSGTVVFVSRNQGMLVVQHEEGFTVVEMLGDEGALEVGDTVRGDWTANGGEDVRRGSETFDGYFQGCWGNKVAAIQIARRTGGG